MKKRVTRSILFGAAMGALAVVLPVPFNLLLLAILVVIALISIVRNGSRQEIVERLFEAGAIVVVIGIAIVLPTKNLDRRVGPMAYEAMPFDELSKRLSEDWGIMVRSGSLKSGATSVEFATDRPMSRKQVLAKLADETGGVLRIGYCGTGASFLFGAHPSFTRLDIAQPDD